MGLPAAPLPLDRLLGHELDPGEQRLLRLRGLVKVPVGPVTVDRDGRVAVAQHQLDGRPDADGVVVAVGSVAVDRDGLLLDLDQLPAA